MGEYLKEYSLWLWRFETKWSFTSPSLLAQSHISRNFWISAMVGPVKSSTGIRVCWRCKVRRTNHKPVFRSRDLYWPITGQYYLEIRKCIVRRNLLRGQWHQVVNTLLHKKPDLRRRELFLLGASLACFVEILSLLKERKRSALLPFELLCVCGNTRSELKILFSRQK